MSNLIKYYFILRRVNSTRNRRARTHYFPLFQFGRKTLLAIYHNSARNITTHNHLPHCARDNISFSKTISLFCFSTVLPVVPCNDIWNDGVPNFLRADLSRSKGRAYLLCYPL